MLTGVAASALLSGATFATGVAAQTLPSGGRFVAGSGSIAASGAALAISQSTSRAIINWNDFSIGAGGTVTISNGAGATLNRVTGGVPSQILGTLSATGSVYLVNPQGVVIGTSGVVKTGGGFVASTLDVTNDTFMAGGAQTFMGASQAGVENFGTIRSQYGDVFLMGHSVENQGGIAAPRGTAGLAAGQKVMLATKSHGQRVFVETGGGDVVNGGGIRSAEVELVAKGGNVYALAGSNGGIISATGVAHRNGHVLLTADDGGTVDVAGSVTARNADGSGGTIVADGTNTVIEDSARLAATGTKGGKVLVGVSGGHARKEAANTTIAAGSHLLAGGKQGGGHIETSGQVLALGAAEVNAGSGGSWLIDPVGLTIDASAASTIGSSLNNGNDVSEQTTGGDLVIAAPISWHTTHTLSLAASNNVVVGAAVTASGGGALVITTGNGSSGDGTGLSFTGGSISFTGVDGSGNPTGALTINGTAYSLIGNAAQLQAIGTGGLAGTYALATDVDTASIANFTPIGNDSTPFTGTFEGLGHAISNVTINAPGNVVGLFGQVGDGSGAGTIRNLGLVNANVTNSDNQALNVGGLAGVLYGGTIANAYIRGTVTSDFTSFGQSLGGLVGLNWDGTITGSSASGAVIGNGGTGFFGNVGGLVGENTGTISQSHATADVSGNLQGMVYGGLVGWNTTDDNAGLIGTGNGTIVSSYATGNVSSGYTALGLGGLVGQNDGLVTQSYATGMVSTADNADMASVGGLVGINYGTIVDAYATGSVSVLREASNDDILGGLVGINGGSIIDAYSTGSVTTDDTQPILGGLVGVNGGGATIANSYWDTTRSGTTTGVGSQSGTDGSVGLATVDWLTQGPTVPNVSGFANPGAWIPGYPYPVLASLPYLVIAGTGTQVLGCSTVAVTIGSITDQNGKDATSLVDTSGISWFSPAVASSVGGTYALGGSGAAAAGYQIAYTGSVTSTIPILLPTNGSFAAGTGSMAATGPSLTVNQSSTNAIIDWNSFSIGTGNVVTINNGQGATLNRITGGTPSQILGNLTATGSVYLVNANGVVISSSGIIRAGGSFAASTLPIDANIFMSSGMASFLAANQTPADISVCGTIAALNANGTGGAITLNADGNVSVTGMLNASGSAGGNITITGGTISFNSSALANGSSGAGGAITLNGSGTSTIAGMLNASGSAGGNITITGGDVTFNGSGTTTGSAGAGGRIGLNGTGNIAVLGTLNASGLTGGNITAAGANLTVNAGTQLASLGGANGSGGTVALDGSGNLTVAGTLTASDAGTNGSAGTIKLLGGNVALAATAGLNASGYAGGGTLLIGGDPDGAGPDANANATSVAPGASLTADALTNGNGGTIVIWSSNTTSFAGSTSARGGTISGNGGLVETSAGANLTVADGTTINTLARSANGTNGYWLLDPGSIVVGTTGSGNVSQTGNTSDTASTITINASIIDGASTNVILAASNSIIVNSPIAMTVSGVGITFEGAGATPLAGPANGTTLNANVTTNGTVAPNTGTEGDITIDGATILGADVTVGTVGRVMFNGTIDGNHSLAVAGYIVTFNSPIGATAPLAGLTTTTNTSNCGTVISNNITTSNGAVTFHGTTTDLNQSAITISTGSGAVDFDGELMGFSSLPLFNLTIATTGDTTFGGIVDAEHGASLLTGTGPVFVGGNMTVTPGFLDFRGPVTLTNDVTLTLNRGNVTFESTVDGNHSLTIVTTLGNATFCGTVGGMTALTGLTSGISGTTLDANVTTTGDINLSGVVTLGGDVVIDAGTSDVTLHAVEGAHRLAVGTTGAMNLGLIGDVTALTGLTTGTGATTFAGTITTTNGAVTVNGPTVLVPTVVNGGGVNISTGTGSVTFNSTIDGPNALNINNSGGVTLNGAVGATTALARLTTGSGTTTLGGNVTTANGTVSIGGASALGANVTINMGSGSLSFAGQLAGNAHALTIIGTGNTVESSGGFANLGAFTTGSGTTSIAGSLVVGGATLLDGNLTVNAAASTVDLSGAVDGAYGLTINSTTGNTTFGSTVGATTALASLRTGGGSTTINGNVAIANGTVSIGGASILGADVTVNAGTGTVQFTGAVDGAHNLTVNAGIANFNGTIGATSPLAALNVTTSLAAGTTFYGNITTSNGAVTFNGATTLNTSAPVTIGTGNGALVFNGVLTGFASNPAFNLTIAGNGDTTFGGPVVSSHGGSLAIGTGTTTLDGNVAVGGPITFGGPVALGADVAITGTLTTFCGTVNGAYNLTTGAATFGGAVGATAALASLTTSGGTATFDANVTTNNGNVAIGGAAVLDANLTINTGTGGVVFTSGVGGNYALTVVSSGTTNFKSGMQGLAALTTGSGLTLVSSGNVSINGATVLNGNFTIDNPVGAVAFNGTIDGAGALNANNTGNTTFGGAIGATTALAGFVTGTSSAATLAGNITTTGAVITGGTTTLGANVTINASAANFAQGVRGGGFALTVTTNGTTSFGSGLSNLAAFTSGTGMTVLNGSITTNNGAVTIGGASTLAQDIIINTGSGAVTFGGAVDGNHSLAIVGTGGATFGGTVGTTTALTGLSTGTGTTTLGGNVTTTGAQSYGGAVVLLGDLVIGTTNAAVSFNGTIDTGPMATAANLTVTTGAGAQTYAGALGAAKALGTLTLNSSNAAGISLAGATNNIAKVAVTANGAVTVADSTTLIVTGISTSGNILVSTQTGNLTVTGTVTTTSATAVALKLEAGIAANRTTTADTSGNVIISGGNLSVGTGGFGTIYTGSITGSTGLSGVVASGNYRYYSDTNGHTGYTTALGTGIGAVYREQPVVTVTATAAGSGRTYDGTTTIPTLMTTGQVNGDTGSGSGTVTATLLNAGNYTLAVTNASAGAALAGLGYAAQAGGGSTYVIIPATVTITGTVASDKSYDGTTTATLSNVGTLTGLIGNQTLSLTETAANFADANAGANKTVTINGYAIANGTGLASNYVLANTSATTTATISQADLTASLTGAVIKAYDGNADASLTSANYILNGTIFGGDTVTLNDPTSGLYGDAEAGGAKTVSVSGLVLSNANYKLTATTASASIGTINPATLTWSVADASGTYGTVANPGAVTLGGFVGGDSAATLGAGVTVLNGSTPVTLAARTAAGSYTEQASGLTGTHANDYVLATSGTNGTLTINPLAVTLAGNITYSGQASVAGSALSVANALAGDTVTLSGIGTLAAADAGSQAVISTTGLALSNGNYTLAGASGSVTVNRATLTWSVADASGTYGTIASPGAVTLGGFVGGDSAATLGAGVTVLNGSTPVTLAARTAAGSYTEQASGLTGTHANDYVLAAGGTDGTLTINPLAVTLSGSMTYSGQASVAGSALGVTNALAGDTVTVSGTAMLGAAGAGSQAIASTIGLTLSDANYTLAGASGSVTIDRAALAITAADQSKTYGQTASLGTTGFTASGLLGGDNVTGVTLASAGAPGTANVQAGGYVLSASAATGTGLANYVISYVPGRLTVTPATLTVLGLSAQGRAYDANTDVTLTGTPNLSGVLNDDNVGLTGTASGVLAAKTAGIEAVIVSGLGLTGTAASNYNLVLPSGLTATISRAPLTLTGLSAQGRTYDADTDVTLTGTPGLSGILGSDGVSLSGTAIGTLAAKTIGTEAITVSGLSLAGADAANYSLVLPANLTADITPALLTATLVGPVTKIYDATTLATLGSGNFALGGILGGDTVTLNHPTAGTYATANAGTGITVSVNGLALGGGAAGNYRLASSSISGSVGTIDQAPLLVTANDASRQVNAIDPVFTARLTGLLGTDTASVVSGLRFTTSATSTSPVGLYTIAVSGGSALDYRLSYESGALAITAAPVMVETPPAAVNVQSPVSSTTTTTPSAGSASPSIVTATPTTGSGTPASGTPGPSPTITDPGTGVRMTFVQPSQTSPGGIPQIPASPSESGFGGDGTLVDVSSFSVEEATTQP